jgi:phage/plasmid primase-like uncharacterized protein
MMIAHVKAIPIEHELARRGVRLKRIGRELVGPCPVCGGRDRFAVNVAKEIWNCRGCAKGGDIVDLVRHLDGVDFVHAVETLAGEQPRTAVKVAPKNKINGSGDDDYERRQCAKARWMWSQRRPIQGSIAETYLRSRGIICPLPPTLGFLPPSKPEHHPAMVSAYTVPDESEPGVLDIAGAKIAAVHLTLLKADGSGKANIEKSKLTLGRPLGLPIVIAPVTDTLVLIISEGIEDALSVYQATGLGTWAAGASSYMPSLKVPDYVEAVTIIADNDKSGQQGAAGLAQQLHQRGGIEIFLEGVSP